MSFSFQAFTEAELLATGLGNGGSLSTGDTFTIPAAASITFAGNDDDAFLSGDVSGDVARDTSGQEASIDDGSGDIGNGGAIFAELVRFAEDAAGNTYLLVQVEQNDTNDEFFTFYEGDYRGTTYTLPPAGTELTLTGQSGVGRNDELSFGGLAPAVENDPVDPDPVDPDPVDPTMTTIHEGDASFSIDFDTNFCDTAEKIYTEDVWFTEAHGDIDIVTFGYYNAAYQTFQGNLKFQVNNAELSEIIDAASIVDVNFDDLKSNVLLYNDGATNDGNVFSYTAHGVGIGEGGWDFRQAFNAKVESAEYSVTYLDSHGVLSELDLTPDSKFITTGFSFQTPIAFDLNGTGGIETTGDSTVKGHNWNGGRVENIDLNADGVAETVEWMDGSGDGLLIDLNKIAGLTADYLPENLGSLTSADTSVTIPAIAPVTQVPVGFQEVEPGVYLDLHATYPGPDQGNNTYYHYWVDLTNPDVDSYSLNANVGSYSFFTSNPDATEMASVNVAGFSSSSHFVNVVQKTDQFEVTETSSQWYGTSWKATLPNGTTTSIYVGTPNSNAMSLTGSEAPEVYFAGRAEETITETVYFDASGNELGSLTMDGTALFGDEGGTYANGFEKLEGEDDNGDGVVDGAELDNLAVWVDDGDARLEVGEIVSLEDAGIDSISTEMTLEADGRMTGHAGTEGEPGESLEATGSVTYSLEGVDSQFFQIDASTGEVTYAAGFVPDFENPQDDGGDNVYDLTVVRSVVNPDGECIEEPLREDVQITVQDKDEPVCFEACENDPSFTVDFNTTTCDIEETKVYTEDVWFAAAHGHLNAFISAEFASFAGGGSKFVTFAANAAQYADLIDINSIVDIDYGDLESAFGVRPLNGTALAPQRDSVNDGTIIEQSFIGDAVKGWGGYSLDGIDTSFGYANLRAFWEGIVEAQDYELSYLDDHGVLSSLDLKVKADSVVLEASPIAFDLTGDGRINTTGDSTVKGHAWNGGAVQNIDLDADGVAETIEWMDGTGDGLLIDLDAVAGLTADYLPANLAGLTTETRTKVIEGVDAVYQIPVGFTQESPGVYLDYASLSNDGRTNGVTGNFGTPSYWIDLTAPGVDEIYLSVGIASKVNFFASNPDATQLANVQIGAAYAGYPVQTTSDVRSELPVTDLGYFNYASNYELELANGSKASIAISGVGLQGNGIQDIAGDVPQFFFPGTPDETVTETVFLDANGDELKSLTIDGTALFGDQGGTYANGFEKLEGEDDNGDGVVDGAELSNLAVWVDDGDARLEAGEIVSLEDAGINFISTAMNAEADGRMTGHAGTSEEVAVDAEAEGLVTYSLEGPDAEFFQIDAATGELTYVEDFVPDFELPRDQDQDNIYDVTVVRTVADSVGCVKEALREDVQIKVQDKPETANISGAVFCDIDGDALDSAGDTPVVQQTVVLLNADGTAALDGLGDPILAFTDVNGAYTFADVPAGDYRVGFEVSSSKGFVAQGADLDGDGRSDDTTASDVDDAAAPFSVSLGVVDITVQATDVFTLVGGTDEADVDAGVFVLNQAPDALDDAVTTLESAAAFIDLLGNDSDPDADTLTIIEAGGTALVGGAAVFSATSADGRTGEVLVSETGTLNFAFDPNGGFDDLNDGETDTVTVSYTISDGNGGTATAEAIVTINGEGQPGATVSGSVPTTGLGDRHVAVILDTSLASTGTAAGIAVSDFDDDGNTGTMADLMLSKVSDMALTLADGDLITLIPSGLGIPDAGSSITLRASVVKDVIAFDAANGNIDGQQALYQSIAATYDPFDFTIDFEQAFNIANTRFDATSGVEQNKVIAMVATEATFVDQGGNVSFFGNVEDAFADVTDATTNADVDVLVIPSGQFIEADNLSSIDSDGTVDVDTTLTFGLDTFIDAAPTVASDADIVSFEVSVDGIVDANIDLGDLTPVADGFDFAPTQLGEGVFDATIGLDLNGDGNADLFRSLSDNVAEADRTLAEGDTFDFELDGFFANPLSAGG